MQVPEDWKDALGILSVAMAIVAAIIYVVQTLRGEIRPHPLSWFLFGIAERHWATGCSANRAPSRAAGRCWR